MNPIFRYLLALSWMAISLSTSAQRINYSEVERDDYRQLNFEIVGKMNANFLIYKNIRGKHDLAIYDNDMKLKDKVNFDFFPDRVINVDFVAYPEFFYMIYQFQRRGIVHCMAAKVDGNGKLFGEPRELDTTYIGGFSDNKIYSTIFSEDKQKIMVFKINRRNERNYHFTTLLYDNNLQSLKTTRFSIGIPDRDAVFSDFVVDNRGDFVFARCGRTGSRDFINKLDLVLKPAEADSFTLYDFKIADHFLDEVKIKADNINNTYLISSFYYKQKRGNIDGMYTALWNKDQMQKEQEKYFAFSDELKADAKADNSPARTAFNDYFIRQIIPKKDGGYVVITELFNTFSRSNPWNRFDYLYSPLYYSPFNYYYWSPYGYNYWNPWNRWNYGTSTRYSSENITIFSFDRGANLQWTSVVRKSQFDDNSDNTLSYFSFISGGELRFLYNQLERRTLLLSEQSVTPDGQVKRNPTLRNLDKGYEFMPKYGKQVSAGQLIIPCLFKNYVCFAKIDLTPSTITGSTAR